MYPMNISADSILADKVIKETPQKCSCESVNVGDVSDAMSKDIVKVEKEEEINLSKVKDLNSKYLSTIRSCLGIKCFDSNPEASPITRVGLLGIPGSGVELLDRLITEMVSPLDVKGPQLIYSTHVPAYGYGKNHGWARIVRVSRMPLQHSFGLLQNQKLLDRDHGNNLFMALTHNNVETKDNVNSINAVMMDEQVRQIVRWQCRLSHVAAHTKMLTGIEYICFQ